MSDRRPAGEERTADPEQDEGFLRRWARLKDASRQGQDAEAPGPGAPPPPSVAREAAKPAGDEETAEAPGDEDMPPLDSLGPDSDYSAFLSPRVSAGLRQKALKKLFMSSKFNITDGLDDYCEDFTSWRPLGSIVTADMKHQMERKLKEQMEKATAPEETVAQEDAPAMAADAGAAEDAAPEPGSPEDSTGQTEAQGDDRNEPRQA